MSSSRTRSLLGVVVAIAVTTAMDATGLSTFSALPLLPLLVLFALLGRQGRREMGFVVGHARSYGWALLHPFCVLGTLSLAATLATATDLSATDWSKAGLNLLLVGASTLLAAILTEEGFFRGWLWASLSEEGGGPGGTLALSSIAFSLWHASAVLLPTGFDVPLSQVPVYLVNAALLGCIWGLQRTLSGSVFAAALGHGLWNAGAYVLFGFGGKVGALGIEYVALWGPESGLAGLLLNFAFAAVLIQRWRRRICAGWPP